MVALEVVAVAQQEPAAALDDLADLWLGAQCIGLVNANPIDAIAAKADDHMEQVIDHFRVRTMLANFEIESRVHVHGDRFNPLAILRPQRLKERPDRFSAVALADPQYAHALGIQSDGRVAVAFVQGEFVHDQPSNTLRREVAMQSFQSLVINGFDGMPVQPREPGHMGNRKQLRQRLDPQAYALCNARTSIKPNDVLGNARIAVVAVQPPDRHIEPHTPVQAVAVADPAPSSLMNQGAGPAAGSAQSFACRTVDENDE